MGIIYLSRCHGRGACSQGRISHLTAPTNVRGPGPEDPSKDQIFSSKIINFACALRAFFKEDFGRALHALSYLKDMGFLVVDEGP